ncbi:serine protease 7-like [Anoplophora glabripennis]|uniref:serine protease 7-like n=1 Tax=Anoplophora glabripennis TaxID=217634 RepID=UPI0008748271|nr:serine protease 7-like [Anoplophora glabripennis]
MMSFNGTVVLIFCLIILQTVYAQIGSSCRTPNGESAKCKSIYDCKLLLDAVQSRNAEQLRFLRESQCGYDRKPLVCCGTKDNFSPTIRTVRPTNRNGPGVRNPAIPDRSKCGFQEKEKIFGGVNTDFNEFPWMALLEYKNASNSKKFSCGGAIISKRYIITAAHCITGDISKKVGQLVNVRLGEWDLRQEVDCVTTAGFNICNKPPENFGIEQTLVHPDYDIRSADRYGDIALIRVNREIKYSDFIRPICLPLPNEASTVGEELYVAGWGKTEFVNLNPVKLKLGVPIAERSHCVKNFKSAGVNLDETQICAGGQKGKDSCTGDSGGPLMRTAKNDTAQWYMEGIVSFGANCGTEGWPGVYTKVSKYVDWIHENVRD